MKSVFILLAARNGEAFIGEQIQSILNQTIIPKKIIVNIDKSTDKTLNVVNSYKKKYKEIEIFSSSNFYGSAAANFIYLLSNVNFSNCDYIAFADQDDIWKKDRLHRSFKYLNNNYDGYSSNVEAFWVGGKSKIIKKNQPQKKLDFLFESAGPGCTFVLSKKLALSLQQFLKTGKVGSFDNYHDWLIYAFARCNGFNWFIDSYTGINYRQHGSNVFGANVGLGAFVSRVNRVLIGEGFDFAFRLMKVLKIKDEFIESLFPISRINLLRLAFHATHCRRRIRDQVYFFFACLLLAIILPSKLNTN